MLSMFGFPATIPRPIRVRSTWFPCFCQSCKCQDRMARQTGIVIRHDHNKISPQPNHCLCPHLQLIVQIQMAALARKALSWEGQHDLQKTQHRRRENKQRKQAKKYLHSAFANNSDSILCMLGAGSAPYRVQRPDAVGAQGEKKSKQALDHPPGAFVSLAYCCASALPTSKPCPGPE